MSKQQRSITESDLKQTSTKQFFNYSQKPVKNQQNSNKSAFHLENSVNMTINLDKKNELSPQKSSNTHRAEKSLYDFVAQSPYIEKTPESKKQLSELKKIIQEMEPIKTDQKRAIRIVSEFYSPFKAENSQNKWFKVESSFQRNKPPQISETIDFHTQVPLIDNKKLKVEIEPKLNNPSQIPNHRLGRVVSVNNENIKTKNNNQSTVRVNKILSLEKPIITKLFPEKPNQIASNQDIQLKSQEKGALNQKLFFSKQQKNTDIDQINQNSFILKRNITESTKKVEKNLDYQSQQKFKHLVLDSQKQFYEQVQFPPSSVRSQKAQAPLRNNLITEHKINNNNNNKANQTIVINSKLENKAQKKQQIIIDFSQSSLGTENSKLKVQSQEKVISSVSEDCQSKTPQEQIPSQQPKNHHNTENFLNRNFYHSKIYKEKLSLIQNEELLKYVLKAPKTKSIKELSLYLTKNSQTELKKHWMIFLWIAYNITYNMEGLLSGNLGKNDAQSVLESKTAVCEGFSNIYTSLAIQSNLKAKKVSGYAKGISYTYGSTMQETNHAWNIIEIDGNQYLLDSTWGAKQQDSPKIETFYFISDPEYIIFDHLPQQDKNQLIQTGVSKWTLDEFFNTPHFQPSFFNCLLYLEGSKQSVHEFKRIAQLKLFCINSKQNLNLGLQVLTHVYQVIGNRQFELKNCDIQFQSIKNGEAYTIAINTEKKGDYLVQVFGERVSIEQDENKSLNCLFYLQISVETDRNPNQPYGICCSKAENLEKFKINKISQPFRTYFLLEPEFNVSFEISQDSDFFMRCRNQYLKNETVGEFSDITGQEIKENVVVPLVKKERQHSIQVNLDKVNTDEIKTVILSFFIQQKIENSGHSVLQYELTFLFQKMKLEQQLLINPKQIEQQKQNDSIYDDPIFIYKMKNYRSHYLYQSIENIPLAQTVSILSIGKYLRSNFQSEIEVALRIFIWICRNIKQHTSKNISQEFRVSESVFELSCGTAQGFSNLFQSLAEAACLKTRKIKGTLKKKDDQNNSLQCEFSQHHWNMLEINEKKYHVDTYSGGSGGFQETEFFYFLPDPKYLILSHYPENQEDQLLKHPQKIQEFQHSSFYFPKFFLYRFELEHMKVDMFQVERIVKFKIFVNNWEIHHENIEFYVQIYDSNLRKLNGSDYEFQSRGLADENSFEMSINIEKNGKYLMNVQSNYNGHKYYPLFERKLIVKKDRLIDQPYGSAISESHIQSFSMKSLSQMEKYHFIGKDRIFDVSFQIDPQFNIFYNCEDNQLVTIGECKDYEGNQIQQGVVYEQPQNREQYYFRFSFTQIGLNSQKAFISFMIKPKSENSAVPSLKYELKFSE